MARKATEAPAFDEFWALYPVHKDRKRAEQAWQRLTAGDRRAALAALPGYTRDCQQQGIQFKYAQGWLNGRRWEDEVSDPTPAPPLQGRGVPCGQTATKRAQFPTPSTANAQPLPSHPRGGAGVGSETSPIPPVGMEKW